MVKKIIRKIIKLIFPLDKNRIVFESLNDFDSNSGALYDYIVKNNLNNKYKIIWLVKNSIKNGEYPKNVKVYNYYNRSLFAKINIVRAKYLIWDNVPIAKFRKEQKSIYLTHGFPVIKNVKGIINVPEETDYVICSNKDLENFMREQFSMNEKTQILLNGYPRNDYLFKKNNELKKLTSKKYSKVIIWMPTFRKAKNVDRNDSSVDFKYGIPIIQNENEFEKLNSILNKNDILLIIKIHSGQNLNVIKIKERSNIMLLTNIMEKEKDITLYKLLAGTDALITDYSSVAFDYLLINKPIAYTIDDIEQYKLGFAFSKIYDMMPGEKIKNYNELLSFIENINSSDKYKKNRKKILNQINEFQDDKNCKRLINMLDKL